METSERIDGPTPSGGAYAVAHFLDAEGRPAPKAKAASTEITEHAADGRAVARTYLSRGEG